MRVKVKSGCACLVVSQCDTCYFQNKKEGIVINNYSPLHNSVNTRFFSTIISAPQCDICHAFAH